MVKIPIYIEALLFFLFLTATPIPKHLGLYQYLFSFHPAFVGLYPWTISNEDQWGFSFKELYNDDNNQNQSNLHGQTAIVTGANSGIGYEISLALARLGVTVTMACRDPSKCAAAATKIRKDDMVVENKKKRNKGNDDDNDDESGDVGLLVRTMTVDMSSLKSVKKFCIDYNNYQQQAKNNENENDNDANHNQNQHQLVDMLFFNAGIKYAEDSDDDGSSSQSHLALSEDGIEQIFATNVVGHHLMYKLLVEQPMNMNMNMNIRTTRTTTTATTTPIPIRIVSTSSAVSYLCEFPYKVATDIETLNSAMSKDPNLYHQSKLAQVLWTKELTSRLDSANSNDNDEDDDYADETIIYANSANPGAVATKIWTDDTPITTTAAAGSSTAGYSYSLLFWSLFNTVHQYFMWTPEEAALTLLYLGTSTFDLQQNNIRGKYFHPQSTLMEEDHKLFAEDDNERDTKLLQEKLWKFLDELVADFV